MQVRGLVSVGTICSHFGVLRLCARGAHPTPHTPFPMMRVFPMMRMFPLRRMFPMMRVCSMLRVSPIPKDTQDPGASLPLKPVEWWGGSFGDPPTLD